MKIGAYMVADPAVKTFYDSAKRHLDRGQLAHAEMALRLAARVWSFHVAEKSRPLGQIRPKWYDETVYKLIDL